MWTKINHKVEGWVGSHLKYTIPPAIALTLLHRPFATRLDFYKIGWLILVRHALLGLTSFTKSRAF